jgi:hypothetical protein
LIFASGAWDDGGLVLFWRLSPTPHPAALRILIIDAPGGPAGFHAHTYLAEQTLTWWPRCAPRTTG